MIGAFGAIVRRDLRLGLRRGADSLQPVLFLVLALALFPLGVGPAPEILARIGVGVIWVLALLAVMMSLDRLYLGDAEDGSLELLASAALPLELVALAKSLAHWLTSGLVLVLASAVGLAMTGRFLPHYFVHVLPACALVASIPFAVPAAAEIERRRRAARFRRIRRSPDRRRWA